MTTKKNAHLPVWQRSGELWPMGVPTSLSWNEIGAVLMAIQEYCVTSFIEVGVDQGGLASTMLSRFIYQNKSFHYFGIELHVERIAPILLEMNPPILIGDCFGEESITWVKKIIKNDSNRVLILCDGGDKIAEMKTFSPMLRGQDIIMAHDFGREIGWNDIPSDVEVIEKEWLRDTDLVLARKK